jgi:hypothetical protein
MGTKPDAEAVVRKNKGGTIDSTYGPNQVGTLEIWETWVEDRDEYCTRFVVYEAGKEPVYHSEFHLLASSLDARVKALDMHAGAVNAQRTDKRIILWTCVVVFLASAGLQLYLTVTGIETNTTTYATFVSMLIAVAGALGITWPPSATS